MSNARIVKRYANRKLYDTERSCYVTLEDLAVLIREGEEVRIIDNKTAEDLTTVTLAQIIFETEKKSNFMPLSLLRGLIQDSGSALRDFAKDGVGAVQQKAIVMAESASKLKSGLEERFVNVARQSGDGNENTEDGIAQMDGSAQKAPMVKELISRTKQAFERLQKSVEPKIAGPLGNVARFASLRRDMEDIRQRIDGLDDRINSLPQETGSEAHSSGEQAAE